MVLIKHPIILGGPRPLGVGQDESRWPLAACPVAFAAVRRKTDLWGAEYKSPWQFEPAVSPNKPWHCVMHIYSIPRRACQTFRQAEGPWPRCCYPDQGRVVFPTMSLIRQYTFHTPLNGTVLPSTLLWGQYFSHPFDQGNTFHAPLISTIFLLSWYHRPFRTF